MRQFLLYGAKARAGLGILSRDLTSIVRAEDGSFDPSGKLTGVKEFSAEEFAARDIAAIKNPPPAVALTGDPPSAKELEDMTKAAVFTLRCKSQSWTGYPVAYARQIPLDYTSQCQSAFHSRRCPGGQSHGL